MLYIHYTYMYTYNYVYMHTHTHTCVCVCLYIHMRIYTTYICIHMLPTMRHPSRHEPQPEAWSGRHSRRRQPRRRRPSLARLCPPLVPPRSSCLRWSGRLRLILCERVHPRGVAGRPPLRQKSGCASPGLRPCAHQIGRRSWHDDGGTHAAAA